LAFGRLVGELRRVGVDRAHFDALDGASLIDRLADDIDDAAD